MHAPTSLHDLSHGVEVFVAILALVFLVASLDDLFIDAWYWIRRGVRSLQRCPRLSAGAIADLRSLPERPLAIIVPAWREQDVIGPMLRCALDRLEYRNYMVFVGTYPNDTATAAEVDRLAAITPRIRRVEVTRPGPTSRADCLNHLVAAVFEYERLSRTVFSGFVLHDSEDVMHPLELKVFNRFLGTADMLQLPVVPLLRRPGEMVAGTYLDEFAENHAKEMLVRQDLCGAVPSAAVGTCFTHRAMQVLWRKSGGAPFRTGSLAEGYEVAMRMCELGLRSQFLTLSAPHERIGRTRAEELVAVRECFPDRVRTVARQKARWMLGIGLLSWGPMRILGRPWPFAYFQFHDRKGIVSALLPAGACLVLLYALLHLIGSSAGWWAPYAPQLFRAGSAWQELLCLNGLLLLVRACHRACFTASLHGWAEGLLSVPRMFIGTVLNCIAACRAWRIFLAHRITGRPLAWDKTAHRFPEIPGGDQFESRPATLTPIARRARNQLAHVGARRAARQRPAR